MKTRLYIFCVLLTAWIVPAYATRQIPDIIIYKGQPVPFDGRQFTAYQQTEQYREVLKAMTRPGQSEEQANSRIASATERYASNTLVDFKLKPGDEKE